MDPEKLVFVDKQLVRAIRFASLAFSLLLALLCVMIFFGVLKIDGAYTWACLPLAAALIFIGVLQAFWVPYTKAKVAFFSDAYLTVGALLCVLVLGFPTVTYLGWLLLLIVNVVTLGRSRAWIGYGVMLFSIIAWTSLHWHAQSTNSLITIVGNALATVAVLQVVSRIWFLADDSVKGMEASQQRENVEHGQLASLVNSMTDGVIAVDEQVNVILYNAAALEVLDSNSSMQNNSIGQFLKPLTKEGASIDIVNLIQNTRTPTINRDLRIQYQDGSFINLYLAIAPVHLGYGKGGLQGFVLLLRDITREKSLEEERDEFISVVSHELRTPIAISEGNISNAQMIAEKSGDMVVVKQSLEEAHVQVIFLADMINDLATLSRAERGKLKLEITAIPTEAFMGELARNYQADATKKGLELKMDAASGLTDLSSSKLYVREVLQNFITNAIKYTESGSVTIGAKPAENGILFTVADTGIGISKADQERVFDKFFRSEDYRTRKHNGTGLGLYVTMKLAKLIQADINVESVLDKGSTFSIFIPNLHEAAKASLGDKPADSATPEPEVPAPATTAVEADEPSHASPAA